MTPKDWTLLAIAAADGEPLTPIQLQKSLFLFGQKMPNEVGDNFFSFVPYDYGPYCAEIYREAERLAQEKSILILPSPGGRYQEYRLTPLGHEAAIALKTPETQRAIEYLESVVKWARSQTFTGLLSAVYEAFPAFAVRSVFRQSS